MADSKFTVQVVVSSDNGMKLAEKNVRVLGESVQRTSKSNKEAAKTSQDLFDTQKKGIIGTANSTRSFSKLAETIGRDGSSGLVGAYATLAANIFAVTAAFNALRGAAQVEQVLRGLEAAGIRTGRSLTTTARSLREVTQNAISTEESLRAVAQITSAGFGEDTVKRLGQAARDTSFALGRNMTDSLDRLTRGVVKLEPELLDELGIMTKLTESSALYANSIGKTESQLTNFEKRTGFLNAVLAEAELKFGQISDAAGDSTAYDKLSATFSDLSKESLNVVNSITKPIAEFAALNKGVLLGAVLLFASTLKNQLLPGFLNIADATSKAAAKLKEEAAAKRLNIEATRDLVRQQRQEEALRVSNINYVGNKAPKAYLALRDSIRAGTQQTADYDKAITSLNRSLTANQRVLDENINFGPGTAKRAAKIVEMDNIRNQITQLEELKQARALATQEDLSNTDRVIEARKQAAIATAQANREMAAASAMNAAANLELRSTFWAVAAASSEYKTQLLLANTASLTAATGIKARLIPALITARTALYTVGLAARTMGVMLLAALPYIGLAVAAFGALQAAWESLKSDRTKAIEKAFKELGEITGKTNDYLQEMVRINGLVALESQKTSKRLTIQSNAVREVADAYEKLKAAQDIRQGKTNDIVKGEVAGLFSTDRISYFTEIEKGSKVLEAFRADIRAAINTGSDNKELIIGTAQALNSLAKTAPDAVNGVVKYYGGWEKFTKLPIEEKLKAVDKIIADVDKGLGGVGQQVKDLEESFKSLEQATSEFIIGSVQKTSYDEVVKNINSVSLAIKELEISAKRTEGIDWKNLLAGLGPQTSTLLTPDTQKALEMLKVQDNIVQTLEKQRQTTGQLSILDEANLAFAKAYVGARQNILDKVKEEILAARQVFLQAQFQERTLKGQLDLLNAHIQANSELYSMSAAGMRARIAQEEKARDLQKAQLQTQLNIQESLIAQAEATLASLKSQDELLSKTEERLTKENQIAAVLIRQQLANKGFEDFGKLDQGILTKESYLATTKETNRETALSVAKLVESYNVFGKSADKIEADRLERAKNIEATENRIRDAQANIVNLKNQIAVLTEQNLTGEQKLAKIKEAEGQFNREVLDSLKEQRAILKDTEELQRSANAIVSQTENSLSQQLDTIRRLTAEKRRALDIDYKANRSQLQDQLRVAKAAGTRPNLDPLEKEAAAAAVSNIETQIKLEEQKYNIQLAQLNAQERLDIVQKAYFDTTKEGLEWQQQGLQYLEKAASVARELAETTQDNIRKQAELNAARRGFSLGEKETQALDIKAAAQAYKLAVEEVGLKKSLIDLEYALLDAQKQQLREDLAARKASIDPADPHGTKRIAQLDAVIANLDNIDLTKVAETAKRNLDSQVEKARLELETTMQGTIREATGLFKLISEGNGIKEARQAREEAKKLLIEATKPKVLDVVIDNNRSLNTTTPKNESPIVSSNNNLIDAIDRWIVEVQKALQVTATQFGKATTSLQEAQAYSERNGIRITERIGELTGAHKGAGHKEGRAFDASIAPGNQDSTNPNYRKKMDAQARLFQSEGFIVLWNGERYDPSGAITKIAKGANQHLDHMHVEIARGMEVATSMVAKSADVATAAMTKAVEMTTDQAQTSVKEILDNAEAEIVVLGTKSKSRNTGYSDPKSDKSSGAKPPQDFSILQDSLSLFNTYSENVISNLEQLGPDGAPLIAAIQGFSNLSSSVLTAMQTISESGIGSTEGIVAMAAAASSALSTIQSVTSAAADAKIAAIDREIAAEQKRDGKSAESAAKIAALEKKKDEIARKQFNTNKKLMMANAVIGTAAGIAQALGSLPPPASIILAGLIGAMGAAQLAVIAGTQYQSTSTAANTAAQMPDTLKIGKRGDSVDLAKQNTNVGGEVGYIRGTPGIGNNSANYKVIGSAYGGELPRGYGSSAYVVGEKGPETITPDTPITVRPANDNNSMAPVNATLNINALDASGVAEVLHGQRGNIISMLREAANANGQNFLEDVDVNVYTRPNVSRL